LIGKLLDEAIAFLRRAVAHDKSYGVTVQQLITDGCLKLQG